jgi:hypothetical protein
MLLRVNALGYEGRTDTVGIRPGVVDTIVVPIRVIYGQPVMCAPPQYRRNGEKACAQYIEGETEMYLELGQRLATDPDYRKYGLGSFTPDQVTLVREEKICKTAGVAYGRGKGPGRKVIVIRLGSAGYLVYDPFMPETAGEFATSMIFDLRWRFLFGIDS